MGKAVRCFLEKWGHYVLSFLCVAAILLSSLWTRQQQAAEAPGAQALSDGSQRLSQVTEAPEAFSPVRPCGRKVLRPFSREAVYFPEIGLWQTHPGVDFMAEAGDGVAAVGAGTVAASSPWLRVDHGGGWVSEYRGLRAITVQEGQSVRAGQKIGEAGAGVPLEGAGHVCVRLYYMGAPASYGEDWLTNE